MWLLAVAGALTVVAAFGRVTNLRLLAAMLATVHLVTVAAIPVSYLAFAFVEVAVVFLALRYWCHASSAVAKISIIAGLVHLGMYAWYQHPTPYGWFMLAYEWYPHTIRAAELLQVAALVYWMPQTRALSARFTRRKKEPTRWMEFSRER